MAQRDATPAQLDKLASIRKEFGRGRVRTYRVDPNTGVMHAKVQADSGMWRLDFNRNGNLIGRWFDPKLPLEPIDNPNQTQP